MSDISQQPGYVAPSIDLTQFDEGWEASIEVKIANLNTKTTIALACGIGGMGLGLVANFVAKKLVDSLQEIGNVVNTLAQVESQRGTFGGPIVTGPGQQATQQEWGAVRPDTSHIGRTTPVSGPSIDDSNTQYEGPISTPSEGPQSAASEEVRRQMLSDAVLPKDIVKDEGIH